MKMVYDISIFWGNKIHSYSTIVDFFFYFVDTDIKLIYNRCFSLCLDASFNAQ